MPAIGSKRSHLAMGDELVHENNDAAGIPALVVQRSTTTRARFPQVPFRRFVLREMQALITNVGRSSILRGGYPMFAATLRNAVTNIFLSRILYRHFLR